MKKILYGVYYGDKFIDVGTISELSERLHLAPSTIRWYAGCNRIKNSPFRNKVLQIFKIDLSPDEKKECFYNVIS